MSCIYLLGFLSGQKRDNGCKAFSPVPAQPNRNAHLLKLHALLWFLIVIGLETFVE